MDNYKQYNTITRQPRRVSHHVIQDTMSEGFAQDPYVVDRVGFEPSTLQTHGTERTTPLFVSPNYVVPHSI